MQLQCQEAASQSASRLRVSLGTFAFEDGKVTGLTSSQKLSEDKFGEYQAGGKFFGANIRRQGTPQGRKSLPVDTSCAQVDTSAPKKESKEARSPL